MLPHLGSLKLAPTGANIRSANWDPSDICSLCLDPVSAPSTDPERAWPFAGDGSGFTIVACLNGDVFHKGCLRSMMRTSTDRRCPDCRQPMIQACLDEADRQSPQEQQERAAEEQRQRERREAARRRREEEEERERQSRAVELWGRCYLPGFEKKEPFSDAYAMTARPEVCWFAANDTNSPPAWRRSDLARDMLDGLRAHITATHLAGNDLRDAEWMQRISVDIRMTDQSAQNGKDRVTLLRYGIKGLHPVLAGLLQAEAAPQPAAWCRRVFGFGGEPLMSINSRWEGWGPIDNGPQRTTQSVFGMQERDAAWTQRNQTFAMPPDQWGRWVKSWPNVGHVMGRFFLPGRQLDHHYEGEHLWYRLRNGFKAYIGRFPPAFLGGKDAEWWASPEHLILDIVDQSVGGKPMVSVTMDLVNLTDDQRAAFVNHTYGNNPQGSPSQAFSYRALFGLPAATREAANHWPMIKAWYELVLGDRYPVLEGENQYQNWYTQWAQYMNVQDAPLHDERPGESAPEQGNRAYNPGGFRPLSLPDASDDLPPGFRPLEAEPMDESGD